MDNTLYRYAPIVERPPLQWPNGARLAFYVGLNIEHFEVDKPSSSLVPDTNMLVPDALNHGWRDYGTRVGIWRVIDALDRHGLRASALLNSDAARHYPQIVQAGLERDWAWLAHGKTNSLMHANLDVDSERAQLRAIITTLRDATQREIHGWMGPGLSETFDTPRLLRELGLSYVLDWCADDQPFPLAVDGMLSVPYSVELNDYILFLKHGASGADFERAVIDQFDQLYEEGGRVMALALHPFLIGQPFRIKSLERALAHITRHRDVWLTTSDEIAAYYTRAAT
ncbi:MAG: polysaccharide deacetylase family protein [Polyangiales bacterium]